MASSKPEIVAPPTAIPRLSSKTFGETQKTGRRSRTPLARVNGDTQSTQPIGPKEAPSTRRRKARQPVQDIMAKMPPSPRKPDSEALLSFTHKKAETLQSKITAGASGAAAETSSVGHIRVYARLRPVDDRAASSDGEGVLVKPDGETLVVSDSRPSVPPAEFKYNRVFGVNASQHEVFGVACRPLIDAVLRGFNGTLMAYGQTGSGKTHTMGSMSSFSLHDGYLSASSDGMIPQTIDELFARAKADKEHTYKFSFSYVQIYQEEIFDVLCPDHDAKTPHALREDPNDGVFIEGITPTEVFSAEDVKSLLAKGRRRLVVAETKMNRHSSRSHALATIEVHKLIENDDDDGGEPSSEILVHGKLTLCDLAGSERISRTGSEGQRLSEAQAINSSLLELGNVVSALADPTHTHVPFRNSTLTRLMQESLGGNCKTSLIVCCSTLSRDTSETKAALAFGQRAMSVVQKARINVQLDYRHIANELALELERKDEVWERIVSRLNQRIEQLEKELAALKRTHDATHNDLAEKIIEAEHAGADAVREAREEMTAEMAARETAAAEREARLQHEITELKEAAEAVAFKTATQMAAHRKKRMEKEKEAEERIVQLEGENFALLERVADLEASVEEARNEAAAHAASLESTTSSSKATTVKLYTKLAAAENALAEARASAAAAVAAEAERGRAVMAAREDELRAEIIPTMVDAEVARVRVALEQQMRAELADEQAVWVMHQAAVTEQMRSDIERELRERAAEAQAAWVAEQEAAADELHERMFAAAREEVAAEAQIALAASKEAAESEAAQRYEEEEAALAAREARHEAEMDAAIRELETLRAENETLRNQATETTEHAQELEAEVQRQEAELSRILSKQVTVENSMFHPTRVVQTGAEIEPPKEEEIAARKKKKFLLCC